MKVFITGSSGLIGKWTAEKLLAEGYSIKGYDKRENHYAHLREYCVVGDILDWEQLLETVQSFQPNAVIHLAARCDLEGLRIEDYDANITGVRHLCNAVQKTNSIRRAIYTSSQLVCKVGHVPKDDREYCPNTIYGQSKVKTEEVVREEKGGGVTWCLTRPTTVWGPYMEEHYKGLLRHIQKGTYFHSGNGSLFKSYAYAENIAHQYYKLLTAPETEVNKEVFYLADYKPLSLRDYANALSDAMGVRRPPTLPLPLAKLLACGGDILNGLGLRFPYNNFRLRNIRTEYIFDMSKTENVCGALPRTFDQGVAETAKWYLDEGNR